jgi:DNA-binding response OmpR family regulator
VRSRPTGPILLIDADRERAAALTGQLLLDDFAVELARSAEHGRILARARMPELVLLGEIGSPRGALTLLDEIRSSGASMPWDTRTLTIVLGGDGDELDVIRAFEAGADDFLPRAAGYLELRARIHAILRRARDRGQARYLTVAGLTIDSYTHSVAMQGRALELRRMEFELLCELAREPTRVFTRDELLHSVWGYRAGASTRTLDSHASRLRRKLEVDQSRRWVLNVWGVGYRLI